MHELCVICGHYAPEGHMVCCSCKEVSMINSSSEEVSSCQIGL